MGKLVLYLADGTTLDIRLARERITIGRRADNDVCLPYPAVSGEHAAVVTILSDSFLEDLGSTNGTLVNGKPVAKHFLRDRDNIDIGKQKLIYVADESVQLEPGPQSLGRLEAQLYGERVEAVRPVPSVVVPDAGGVDDMRNAKPVPSRGETKPAPGKGESRAPSGGGSMSDIERFVAAELGTPRAGDGAPASTAVAPGPEPAPKSGAPVPALRVLTGPSAGRELILDKDEMAVGRVGVQVATVRRADGTFRLVPLEGAAPPSVNGAPVPAEGQALKPGDFFEIAGVRLEMFERPAE
ncbi:MAG: FHA domain-containing protein [Casimicrobiaceae bacterium]